MFILILSMALYQNFTTSSSGTITIPGPIIGTHTSNTIANIFTTGGRVGINTTNPVFTLDVNGTINTTTFTGGNISVSGSIISGNNVEAIGSLTNGGYDFILGNSNQVARGNSGLSRALVKDGLASLKINFAGDFTGGTEVQGTSLSHSGFFSASGNSNTLGNLVTTGGNIGIGTRTPSQIIHLQRSGSDNYIKIDAGGVASNFSGLMLTEHNLNFGWALRHDASTDLLYISYQDNTPSFTNTTIFNRSGQIGINKTPAYTLDINGSRLNLHNAAGTNGGQNLFEGIVNDSSRGQIVISSMYSDMVIASSQANDFHGSTLTFASYNPSNKADYRKWVINQGNWGSRVHMLDFGYRTTVANPHDVIQDGFVTMTLDGTNQRVGIGNRNPTYKLDISTASSGTDSYGLRVVTSTSTSGFARTYGLWVDATGSDDGNYAAIFNTGNVGIGNAAPSFKLDVNGDFRAFGGRYIIQNGQDGGTGRGIYMWTEADTNWAIYMGQSGAGKSFSGGTATTGVYSFAGHALRFRVSGSTTNGWIFENSSEGHAVSIRADGQMYVAGNLGIGTVSPTGPLTIASGSAIISHSLDGTFLRTFYTSGNAAVSTVYNYQSGKNVYWGEGGDTGIYYFRGRTVSIGADSTSAKLHVEGSVNTNLTATYYNTGGAGLNTTVVRPLSIYASAHIACQELQVFSDERIKSNIQDISDSSALETLRLIQPKTYTYIDTKQMGNQPVYGFIAQQVKSVLNYAVSEVSSYIPNIYCRSDIIHTTNGSLFTLINGNTSQMVNTNTSGSFAIMIKIYYGEQDEKQEISVKQIIDNTTFLTEPLDTSITNVFVYGQLVNNFNSLNKNSIYTLAVAALQEVDRQLQEEKQNHQNTKQELAILKTFIQSKFPNELN